MKPRTRRPDRGPILGRELGAVRKDGVLRRLSEFVLARASFGLARATFGREQLRGLISAQFGGEVLRPGERPCQAYRLGLGGKSVVGGRARQRGPELRESLLGSPLLVGHRRPIGESSEVGLHCAGGKGKAFGAAATLMLRPCSPDPTHRKSTGCRTRPGGSQRGQGPIGIVCDDEGGGEVAAPFENVGGLTGGNAVGAHGCR